MTNYPLASLQFTDEEEQSLQQVIDSGFFTMGKRVKTFESAFAEYHQRQFAVMVNSGSSANLLAIASLRYHQTQPLMPGDEIIVPALAWATTYHPLQQYGLKIVIVDIDLNTLNTTAEQISAAITDKTKAIMVASILGNPAPLDAIRELATNHNLWFIEDNCESLDASLNGKKTGTFGDVATFSFFFSHHINTIEGGMLLTDNEMLYQLALSLRAHGWTRDLPEPSVIHEPLKEDCFEAYRFILPGYNLRPTELNASLGLVQLAKLEKMTAQRRQNWQLFQTLFQDHPIFLIQQEYGCSSAFSFTLVIRPECVLERNQVFAVLEQESIGYRMITGGNILRHDVIQFYDHKVIGTIKNTNTVHDRGFFVGNHAVDYSKQINRLYTILSRFTKN